MTLVKTVRCDLHDGTIPNGDGIVVRVGRREWRGEDFHQIDVCEACQQHKDFPALMAVFAARDEGMVH